MLCGGERVKETSASLFMCWFGTSDKFAGKFFLSPLNSKSFFFFFDKAAAYSMKFV